MGESDGAAEGRRLGGADHRHSRRHHPRAGAPHGGKPHHDQRVVVAAARRSRRAAVLGGVAAGVVPRPDRAAGRRLRLRLRLGRRASPSRRRRSARPAWSAAPIRSTAPFRRRGSRSACCIPASLTTSTAAAAPIRTSSWCTGRAAIRSTITRTPISCAPRSAGRKPSSCTSRGGRRPRATPTSCCRRRPRLSETTSVRAQRDPFVHRHAKGDRAGRRGAQRLFDLSPRWRERLGCDDAFTQGRDEMAWLRHLYDSWRDSVRTNQARFPISTGSGPTAILKSRRAPTNT